jgi:hemerythrin-like metal-binding protein
MQHFKWTKAHAVYLPQVDAEHRNLFRMAEEIHQSARAGAEAARIQELVRSFLAAMEEHFAHEERMMKSAAVPDYEWHKTQHDTARGRAARFVEDIEQGSAGAPMEMLEFLGRWFKDHMGLTDRMMGAHVRNYERLQAKIAS